MVKSSCIFFEGLEKPSAVHQRGIVPLCKGLDVIQQSLYGTTVTLACGVLQRLDYGSAECQALVLVPTRDLAQETEKVIGSLGQWLGVKALACFGGTSVRGDKQFLSSSVQVIVATPGRVLDMLRRQALCPDNIRMFVLDEADEILTGGLKDQVGFPSSYQLSCIVITTDEHCQTSHALIIRVLFNSKL
jgi:translation initiation factor 4A